MSTQIHNGRIIDLHTETCCSCEMVFSMPADFRAERLKDGAIFYCPRGHGQHFTESELTRTKRELAQVKATLADKMTALTQSRCETITERDKREKAEATLKKVGKGKCPCCRRVFKTLAKHIAQKHPGFAGQPPAA